LTLIGTGVTTLVSQQVKLQPSCKVQPPGLSQVPVTVRVSTPMGAKGFLNDSTF